ncbi:MAG: helical backbone metal receptor [Syntrophobacteraceae bacterium]
MHTSNRANNNLLGYSCRIFHVMLAVAAIVVVAAVNGEARLMEDQAGRSVSVPNDPKRIVSLAPSITEIVFALGEGDRLKAVTQHCDYPEDARSLPKVGSYVHLDVERIAAAGPDLCLGVRDGNPPQVVKMIESMGIPVYLANPANLDTMVDAFVEIGQILNTVRKARETADAMHARIERVKVRIAEAKQFPRIFFQIGIVPLVSVGAGTFLHEVITMAGGRNLGEGPRPYPRFSREQVLALEPDIIVITSMTTRTGARKRKGRMETV